MKARRGQVVVYLALALLAIVVLTLMNVGAYLAVSAKNRTMNAGDAAAIAVAKHQGELLNRIGSWNVERLKAALAGDAAKCAELFAAQLRCSFLDPLEGIRIGSEAAAENGIEIDDQMGAILSRHVNDVRMYYLTDPTLYPEPWQGAWEEYAERLEIAVAAGVRAGPDNAEFMNAARDHYLLDKGFYEAVLGRNWCWFKFNAPGLIYSYSGFESWAPLPMDDDETRRMKCVNSEIYSLHLCVRQGSAIELLGTNLVRRLTGATAEEVAAAPLLRNRKDRWFFYDDSHWRVWREFDPEGEYGFPAYGKVLPEYDVRGCAAICRVSRKIPDLVSDGAGRTSVWSAGAKPFGAVTDERGDRAVATALARFVTPVFDEARLVPIDTVGGIDLSTADPEWMAHVRDHLPAYFAKGPSVFGDCPYCQALSIWERKSVREAGQIWLKYNSDDCVRPAPGGPGRGGTPHGH